MPIRYRHGEEPRPIGALDQDEAWRAVEQRDPRFDGQFVYAVGSTGIYCRPSCPSRRPKRVRVTFHASPDEAERAGFRACRRCRPRETSATPAAAAVERARQYLERHGDEVVTLDRLGAAVGISPYHLQRTFKRFVGVSPREYHDTVRLGRLKARLRAGDTVSRATYEAGFGSSSRVYERSDAALGMTPAAYRRGGAGMRITFAIVDCPFGRLLVGATERGVCAVALGDDDAALARALQSDFPQAAIQRGDESHHEWVDAVVEHVAGAAPITPLPLDLHGTAFQRQVWALLSKIPRGRTMSYARIAEALGRPEATRAVARACASNHLAVIVPCHRVVRTDGALGGYKWGLERKRRLLAAEAKSADGHDR